MDTKQVVVVTGSSTGFGRLIAETLARHGHAVYATMRDPKGKNAKNASQILSLAEKDTLPLHVLELDVTDEVSIDQAVQAIVKKSGRIDVAINNAGYALAGLEEAFTTEQAQKLFDTNFFGSVRVNRAVLPHMRAQRSGVLIHITSGAGRVVFPAFGLYCASKFALEAFAESYSYELAGQGIESVIVQPGAYETAVFGSMVVPAEPSRTDTYGATREVLGKINTALTSAAGNPQEVADAVLRIVETPAGEKKLRYRVSASGLGIDEINELSAKVQAGLFEAFGIAAESKFLKGKNAGAA